MTTSTVLITNTTSTTDGLKVSVKEGTWKVTTPAATVLTDLNGARTRLMGAQQGKRTLNFTAVVQMTPATGYAGLGSPGIASPQNLWIWSCPDTAAHASLLVVDVDGNLINGLWVSGWLRPSGITNELNGSSEYYEVPVEIQEQ